MEIECLEKNININKNLPDFNPEEAIDRFKSIINRPDIGFFNIVEDSSLCKDAVSLFQKFSHKKHFIHVGNAGHIPPGVSGCMCICVCACVCMSVRVSVYVYYFDKS